MVPTLLITGTCGVGKSTVAAEINDLLAERKVPNAAVDLDALTWQWPPSSRWNSELMFDNLAVIWPNYRSRGATHLVLAGVLEDRNDLDRYRLAVPGANITVCRLVTPIDLRIERLRARMPPGPSRDWHLQRTVVLEEILAAHADEDFIVENGPRPVLDVAEEILARADAFLS